MKTKFALAGAILLLFRAPGFAHRLDEYLQAALISLEKDRVQVSMRLIPGVAIFQTVLATIDTNVDGIISENERQAYAGRVLRDLSLCVDGKPLQPHLLSVDFPRTEEMKEGLGEIHIEFTAELPRSGHPNRKLAL